MNTNDTLKITGKLKIDLTKPDGKVETTYIKNLVVTDGLQWLCNRMTDASSTAQMDWMAVGSGTTAQVAGDAALETEITRVNFSSVNLTPPSIEYNAYYPAGVGTGAITEAGILNAGVAGEMLARTTFPVVNKLADDSLNIQWIITLSAV